MRTCIIMVGLLLSATAAQAQTWHELQAVTVGTELFIQDQQERHAEGLLQSIEDAQLTITRAAHVYPIERDRIARVQVRKRDPLWNGMLIGLVYAVASHVAFGGGAWSGRETVWNYAGSVGVWALLDLSHTAKRTVYRAP
jgi:hypothetical protein